MIDPKRDTGRTGETPRCLDDHGQEYPGAYHDETSRWTVWFSNTPRFVTALVALATINLILLLLLGWQFRARPAAVHPEPPPDLSIASQPDQALHEQEPSDKSMDELPETPERIESEAAREDALGTDTKNSTAAQHDSDDLLSIPAVLKALKEEEKASRDPVSRDDSGMRAKDQARQANTNSRSTQRSGIFDGVLSNLRTAMGINPVRSAPSSYPYVAVSIYASANKDGDQLRVTGSTNLPGGTRLRLRVFPAKTVWLGLQPNFQHVAEVIILDGGAYEAIVDHDKKFKTGRYVIQLSSRDVSQDVAITRTLGENGEAISGRFVRAGEDGNYIFAEAQRTLRPTLPLEDLAAEKRRIRKHMDVISDSARTLDGLIKHGVLRGPWQQRKEASDEWHASLLQLKESIVDDICIVEVIEKFGLLFGALQGTYNAASIAPPKDAGPHWNKMQNNRIADARQIYLKHYRQLREYVDGL